MNRSNDDMYEFAKASTNYVKEIDKKEIEKEMEQIKSEYHVDHCWIKRNSEKVGVVKILRSTFYGFGLSKNINQDEIYDILQLIEKDITPWSGKRIETTIHVDYLKFVQKNGYLIEFSRKKMRLKLSEVKNIMDNTSLNSEIITKRHLNGLIEMFIDAYIGSVDEKIGMFDTSNAHSAIQSIFKGSFGKYLREMSILVKQDHEIIAAIMTTLTEGCPFIVIVGVNRRFQKTGIGRKLLSWVIEKANQNNYAEIRLWVTVENKPAINLYDSMGFEPIQQVYSLYKNQ